MRPTNIIQTATPEFLAKIARSYVDDAEQMGGFILGTAIAPFGRPTKNLHAIREYAWGPSEASIVMARPSLDIYMSRMLNATNKS